MTTTDLFKREKATFPTLIDLIIYAAEAIKPPERITVPESAERYRFINNPGSYVGKWDNTMAPYLIKPMQCLTDRVHNAVVFSGPAQCGKTELILNWVAHSIKTEPADLIIYEKSQAAARDFSKRRIDRLHRHSKAIGEVLIHRRDKDNTFDKQYQTGMMLTLSYPAINELSGRPVPHVALTDLDRMVPDVDGEGSPFDLARKRTTTFRTYAKTLAESSPGFVVTDPKFIPATKHEAPPCQGILALYNRGDRNRFYWPCPHCERYFEGDFTLLTWPDSSDVNEAGEAAFMKCPHCFNQYGAMITHDMKFDMNNHGVWVPDGMTVDKQGNLVGKKLYSDIASFWLKGTAAAFATWKTLVVNYIKAAREYELTGNQEALKTTVNTDQGRPYVLKGQDSDRLPEDIKARAVDLPEKEVPYGVRYLLAMIDVQKNKWVVQVFGFTDTHDVVLIDRFDIIKSKRKDADNDTLWVKPASYLEDWDLLIEQVVTSSYPLSDGSGRRMQIKLTGCDSGGYAKSKGEGVTDNAYKFWRKLRTEPEGHHKRFCLLKGEHKEDAPRIRRTMPDAKGAPKAVARGDVPVYMINVNVMKDALSGMLDRTIPGGMIIFPKWIPDEVYKELTAEFRTPKGWEKVSGVRNEATDLFAYALAFNIELGGERMDFDNPPSWAADWDDNTLVIEPDADNTFVTQNKTKSLEELARTLA